MGWFSFKKSRTPSQSDKAKKLLGDEQTSKQVVKAIHQNHLSEARPKVAGYRIKRVGQSSSR